MLSDRARFNIAVALIMVGLPLAQFGWLWLVWFTQPWQFYVAACSVGIALFAAGIYVAPRGKRQPRGGPMINPAHTIVLDQTRSSANNDRGNEA